MIPCRELVNLLLNLISEELPEDRRDQIREHLRGCSTCAVLAETYEAASRLPRPLPPHLEQQLREAIAELGFPAVGTEAWGQMNRRRAELIHKKNREGLTEAEREEFEQLQRLSHAALERAYPRPPLDTGTLARLEESLHAASESREE